MTHLQDAMRIRGFDSNEKLAQKLLIPVEIIEAIRNGRSTPSPKLLKKLCQLLSLRSDKLCLLDKNLFDRLTGATTNDMAPADTQPPPLPIQTHVEAVSEPEIDYVAWMLDPEANRQADEFGLAVLAKLIGNREIPEDFRARKLFTARACYWFGDLYNVDSATELLQNAFEQELAELKARSAQSIEAETISAECAHTEPVLALEIPEMEVAIAPVVLPEVQDVSPYFPDLSRPARIPHLQDMPLESEEAA